MAQWGMAFHDANVTESALEEAGLLSVPDAEIQFSPAFVPTSMLILFLICLEDASEIINEKFCSWLEKYTGNEE